MKLKPLHDKVNKLTKIHKINFYWEIENEIKTFT